MIASQLSRQELETLVSWRRDLHRHPELGFEETRTAAIVAEVLRDAGFATETGIGKTGVAGLLKPVETTGPVILIRADMDALPLDEETGASYASLMPGRMHACGHDGHVAIGLTVARQLAARQAHLPGNVRFVFQPAEEGLGGAQSMIDAGVLEHPRVSASFGLHLWNSLDVGQIGVRDGAMMAAVDEFELRIIGPGGHAAAPHQTVDVVLVAAQLVVALQSIVSRGVDPLEPAVVTVAAVHAGSAFNIIPAQATLEGTLRCFDESLWLDLPRRFEMIVAGICQAFGARYELDYIRSNRATCNDPRWAQMVREVAAGVVGKENVHSDTRTMGGEDMSCFLDAAPGCFFFVGAANSARGLNQPHHSPRFDFDEEALVIGAEVLRRVAERALAELALP